jgi:O-antigen/teichoic acid export membrane protein
MLSASGTAIASHPPGFGKVWLEDRSSHQKPNRSIIVKARHRNAWNRLNDLLKLRQFRFAKTPGERQVSVTMVGLVVFTGISQAAGAVTFLILTNGLTTIEFGKLAGALFLQQFFATMSISGFRNIAIREMIRRPERRDQIAGSYLFLSGGMGALILILTALVVSFLPIETDERLCYLLIAFGHWGACLFPTALFDADQSQVAAVAISTLCEAIAVGVIAVCWWIDSLTIPIAAGVIAGKWIASAVLGIAVYKFRHAALRPIFDLAEVKSLWNSAGLMSLATLLNVAPAALGVTLTRILFGSAQAGLFGVAAFVFRTHVTLIGLLTRAVYPHIIGRFGETTSFKKRLLAAYLGLTATLTVLGLICSELMVRYLLPPEFEATRSMIALMLVAATVRVGGIIGNMYLIARHSERLLVIISLLSGFVFGMVLCLPVGAPGGMRTAFAMIAAALVTLVSLAGLFSPLASNAELVDARNLLSDT